MNKRDVSYRPVMTLNGVAYAVLLRQFFFSLYCAHNFCKQKSKALSAVKLYSFEKSNKLFSLSP